MYKVLRRILFLFPPEWVHYFSMNCLKVLCSIGFIRKIITAFFSVKNSQLATTELHLILKTRWPWSGFDKNAKYLRELEALGFWFC